MAIAGLLAAGCTLNTHGEGIEELPDAASTDAAYETAGSAGDAGPEAQPESAGPEASTTCTPGELQCADGGVATCQPDGQLGDPLPCASQQCAEGACLPCPAGTLDCDADPVTGCEAKHGHCFSYTPSNVDPSSYWNWDNATPVTLACDETLDTGALPAEGSGNATLCGASIPYETRTQPGGPNLAIFWLKGLTVAAGFTIKLRGDKPVVFMVDGSVEVAGTIDAGSTAAGPGAGASVASCSAGDGAPSHGGGGGGFQFAGSGGAVRDYGEASSCPATQFAGAVVNTTLVPLRAGCAGGKGANGQSKDNPADFVAPGGYGGFGGGAVQVSASGPVLVTGAITAGGQGGGPGSIPAAQDTEQLAAACGGGGGSGGAILLEGKGVTADDKLFANGGGGGGGGPGQRDAHDGPCGKMGTAGGDGTASMTPAGEGERGEGLLDDACADSGYTPNKWPGKGANGGTTGSPTVGAVCGEHWQGGGGGGGGGGWIVVHSF